MRVWKNSLQKFDGRGTSKGKKRKKPPKNHPWRCMSDLFLKESYEEENAQRPHIGNRRYPHTI